MSRSRTRVSSRIGVEVRRVRRVDAVEDRLEIAGDDRQRRPQLVADVREQRAALLLVGLEPGGHRVEAAGELLDRRQVRAGLADPDAVVAVLDPAGRGEHPVEVAGRAQRAAEHRGEDHDRHERRR